jgi:hypothetical protein
MKVKKLLGFCAAFAATALMTMAVQAATFKTKSVVSDDTVTVTINVSDMTQLNGYVANVGYDADILSPVVQGKDVLGLDCYATSLISNDSGMLLAEPTDTDKNGTNDTVTVSWAAGAPIAIDSENGTDVASVTFKVLNKKTTTVSISASQVAEASDKLVDNSELKGVDSEITFAADFLRGDANGDGVVNDKDATLISQYVVKLDTIESANMLKADANNDGEVNDKDATLISQYVVKLDTISE